MASFLDNIFKKENKNNSNSKSVPNTPLFNHNKPRPKEITQNDLEDSKVKISGVHNFFDFDLKIFGKSIFSNLILTAYAYLKQQNLSNDDDNNIFKEALPIKCVWKRIKNDSIMYIKDINTNSYMPSAEDIGYFIEVEVTPLFDDKSKIEVANISYGPITLNSDIKATLEILLTNGSTNFSCNPYSITDCEKITDKEIRIKIQPSELTLVEVDFKGNETILENVHYHQNNPIIKLHPYDGYRFYLKFFKYELNSSNKESNIENNKIYNNSNINEEVKSEYHLVALSKQNREFIYLLMQFYLIDEKLKNSKLFAAGNYSSLPNELKVSVTDLITEIKTLREENNVLMKNLKFLEKSNKELRNEMKSLEEDFQITLESINCSNHNNVVSTDYDKNYYQNNNSSNTLNLLNNSNNFFDLKKKYDELKLQNSELISKQKAFKEESKDLELNIEIFKNNINELNLENKKHKKQIEDYELDFAALKKSYDVLCIQKIKAEEDSKVVNLEFKKFKEEYQGKLKENSKISENFEDFKLKQIEDKKALDNQQHELKALNQRLNIIVNQKEIIVKEFEKIKSENLNLKNKNAQLEVELSSNTANLKERNDNLQFKLDILKKENKNLNEKIELLEIEHLTFKNNFNENNNDNNINNSSMFIDEAHVKITKEEYDEFEILKREKDETDASLMQLRSNSNAKDLEIIKLKQELANLKF